MFQPRLRLPLLLGGLLASSCLLFDPLGPDTREAESGGRGGDAGQAGAGESAGKTAGSGAGVGDPSGHCAFNADCHSANSTDAFFCRPRDQRCVKLNSESCEVLGDASDPNAVFFGAYASTLNFSPAALSIRWTYELALDDFNGSSVGGLRGASGVRRPLAIVLCNNELSPDLLDASVQHLTEEVGVPAILAALENEDLQRAFERHGNGAFFLSPSSASKELANLDDRGLLWSLLGKPGDLAGIYAALVRRAETYLRQTRGLDKIKLGVVVQSSDGFSKELAAAVLAALSFNGASVTQNLDQGNYFERAVEYEAEQMDAAASDLIAFEPDLVLSFAENLFTDIPNGILPQLELEFAQSARPFYILSPHNAAAGASIYEIIKSARKNGIDTLAYRRFLGVDAAAGSDPKAKQVRAEYQRRLLAAHPQALGNFDNFYDAFYFLAYSLFAAGPHLNGSNCAQGMQRLSTGRDDAVLSVGPNEITEVFSRLSVEGATIRLWDSLGAPNFSTAGIREDFGSVYCFDSQPFLHPGVLLYDPDLDQLTPSGSLPCLADF